MVFERAGDLAVGAVKGVTTAGRAGAVGTRRVQWFPLILVIYTTVQINCVLTFGQEISPHSYQTALTHRVNILHLLMYDVLPTFFKFFCTIY